ncbi:MAG TPA: indolepyruvate oxidoreductase subunit beta family protein [Ramlibacter sp.]|uniref:indolepyruvate oxidoreductase subunit beta family protein n=1 Tax=Ramlibacter sp. TaxID=1917967 RepID=UPI002D09B52C|nr:indolepyruvate oxidoreductase subunit beta family protein [Ramlibacter sp.]HVZ46389.1 indolepyruvate oxidoreductase subunit beta family protein [Ramlibacter sp.]
MRPITLLICALGGEGGGVLTEWLVETARRAGYPAQATSIPGVAQRTGATTYYIEVFAEPIDRLGGRRPVFSLNPVPGALDALVSSELLETARQVANGMTASDRTLVVTSSNRALTTSERMQLGDGRLANGDLEQLVRDFSREHRVFDMNSVAQACGTAVSAVMFGAIAGCGVFPFTRAQYESVVGDEASRRGFARAFDIVTARAAATTFASSAKVAALPPGGTAAHPSDTLPESVREFARLGYDRVLEYQDERYAQLYFRRLRDVLAAERDADPAGEHRHAIARETARWLALWMAFDDIVRVADLKSRASRFERVRREVKSSDGDLLKVYDHFKPGVPEFAALLPPALAARLVAWDRRRAGRGKAPWALPLKIASHGVPGMLALRTLASLRWLRVRGARYAAEQRMIEHWLAALEEGTRRDWHLGHEIAASGRLVKGYGATNERGKENLLHTLDHLARGADPRAAAQAVAAAREAALADDGGRAFDAALARHGAPPRPPTEQPIRFVRKPKATAMG